MQSEIVKILATILFCGAAALSVSAYALDAAEVEPVLTFSSPQEAADFLIDALNGDDFEQLQAVVGKKHTDLLFSGDDIADVKDRKAFAAAATSHMRIELTPKEDRAILMVGENEWPFPLPLVKSNQVWSFDAEQGRKELLNRRIGRNESNVIRVMRGYVEAQFEYASQDRDGDDLSEYAQKLFSDPGTKNGLYWPSQPGSQPSPLGPLVARAQPEISSKDEKQATQPFHGYYYKILYRQGEKAPGGKYIYVLNGNMIAGFGLLAYPARYGESGIYTFTVNHRGEIYQRDLGPATAKIAVGMKDYDPDEKWQPAASP
jgi:hypothetical protein